MLKFVTSPASPINSRDTSQIISGLDRGLRDVQKTRGSRGGEEQPQISRNIPSSREMCTHTYVCVRVKDPARDKAPLIGGEDERW